MRARDGVRCVNLEGKELNTLLILYKVFGTNRLPMFQGINKPFLIVYYFYLLYSQWNKNNIRKYKI